VDAGKIIVGSGDKNLRDHGVDVTKQLGVMGVAIGILVGLSNLGMCSPPWETPQAAKIEHKEIRQEAKTEHKAMKTETDKQHVKIEESFKEHEGEIKQDIRDMKKQINTMYRWEREDRR